MGAWKSKFRVEEAIVLMVISFASVQAEEGRFLTLGFGEREAWTLQVQGPYWGRIDRRDLLNIFHSLVVSETGAFAGAERQVTLPADWQPPFALRFYCADNYYADAATMKPGDLGTEAFFGHRFKQVLIDDRVIWEQDVIDENVLGSPTTFQVDLTPYVAPARTFRLGFRVFDKVSTRERNPQDVWFIGGTWYAAGDGKTEEEPRFHTAAWFGDAVVGEAAAVAAAPPGRRPDEAIVAARHAARWPLPPPGYPMASPATLRLMANATVPSSGFPITCGIPMPPGMLTDLGTVRLRDRQGRDLPLQARPTATWPDGSIRWFLLDTLAPPGAKPGEEFQIEWENGEARDTLSPSPLLLTRQGNKLTVETGALRIDVGQNQEAVLDTVYLAGREAPVLSQLAPRMTVRQAQGEEVPIQATWSRLEVVEGGPVRAQVELHGSLRAGPEAVGRFVFRLNAYAGLPLVQAQFRIFNDRKSALSSPAGEGGAGDESSEETPLEVTYLGLVATLPGGQQGLVAYGGDGKVEVVQAASLSNRSPVPRERKAMVLHQDAPDHFVVWVGDHAGEGKHAAGWIAIQGAHGAVQAAVWRFWPQFPKSLAVSDGTLALGLFAPSGAAPSYQPRYGEAKRHDLWLSFSDRLPDAATLEAVAALGEEPPYLFDGPWFCHSGGVNVLDPAWFDRHPPLAEYVRRSYGEVTTASVTRALGIRDFGDMVYQMHGERVNPQTQWLNGYWAMVQGALNWGLAGSDPRWLQRSFEIARHIADVDSVHLRSDSPDWAEWHGLICTLATPDHCVHSAGAKWPAFQLGESLILHYWMTGDPDSLEAAVANADYIIRSSAGLGSVEARSQARPLLTLLRVWQATGEVRYREAAKRYLNLEYQTQQVMDWRRGAYIQPTYQNWRVISAGLDAMYGHNIYEYYRLTGDLEAAQMVVAIADSIYEESMLPQEENLGDFLFYVRYSRSSWYYPQMSLLFCMAYDLTGDARFLRAARAALERYLRCAGGTYQPFHNFGWIDPELGGWLERFQEVFTKPVEITGPVANPDPSHFEAR